MPKFQESPLSKRLREALLDKEDLPEDRRAVPATMTESNGELSSMFFSPQLKEYNKKIMLNDVDAKTDEAKYNEMRNIRLKYTKKRKSEKE